MGPVSSTLVVATKDRPVDCERLLWLLEGRPDLPDRILVVDASESEQTRKVCEAFAQEGRSLHDRLHWTRAEEAGLPAQRNQALDLVTTELVHFLDDDSRPSDGYFAEIADFFEADTAHRVVGVTGVIVNPPRARRNSALHRLFLLTPEAGRLNRAGRNAIARDAPAPLVVDSLSGCSMTCRTDVARRVRFATELQWGPSGGYALGEDLEFSLRLARLGQLWCLPQARLLHEESETNRASRKTYARAAAAFRRRLAEDTDVAVSRSAFWWSTVGSVLAGIAKFLLGRDRDGLATAVAEARGAFDRSVTRR